MKSTALTGLIIATQAIGLAYFVVFLSAFYLPMPSNDTLIGDPNFRTPMSILGLIFIGLIVASIVAAYAVRRRRRAAAL